MTELDDRIRDDLHRLAGGMAVTDITDGSLRRGRAMRFRRRTSLATAGVAVAVLAALSPLAFSSGTGHGGQRVGTIAIPAKTLHGNYADFHARSFTVAQPSIEYAGTPVDRQQPPCRPSQIAAAARTRRSPDGVSGVVKLVAHGCSLKFPAAPGRFAFRPSLTLVNAEGSPLALARSWYDGGNQPVEEELGYNYAQGGHVATGFSWRGPWCGDAAATLDVRLTTGVVAVPLQGPQPPCGRGLGTPVLQEGIISAPNWPVLTPPPAWKGLRSTLTIAPSTRGTLVRGMMLTLRNPTGSTIALDPMPTYSVDVRTASGESGGLEDRRLQTETGAPVLIGPHAQQTILIPDHHYPFSLDHAFHGKPVQVTLSIGGVAAATATTTAR
jgi:hypothetical protein